MVIDSHDDKQTAESTETATEVATPASGAATDAAGHTAAADEAGETPVGDITPDKLEEMVVDALRTVYDPEIPVNIYDLGLIYDLKVSEERHVAVKMTLTTPHCPVAGSMPGMIEQAVRHVHAVSDCEIELVWDPPWNPDMMTEAARLQLNII